MDQTHTRQHVEAYNQGLAQDRGNTGQHRNYRDSAPNHRYELTQASTWIQVKICMQQAIKQCID